MEPTVGEALCRLFQPDENIDLRRIAQIARQSLKRRDPSGSTKTTSSSGAPASRSASDPTLLPPPPGLTESSSSRSDKLLLGLSDSRTLCQGWALWTTASSAIGTLRTCLSNVLGSLSCRECDAVAAKTKLVRTRMDVQFTARDVDSEIPFFAALLWTLERTLLLNPADTLPCRTNCKWGGHIDRTLLDSGGHFAFLCWQNSRSSDLLLKILRRTFQLSRTLSAFLWTLVILPSVGARFISTNLLTLYM